LLEGIYSKPNLFFFVYKTFFYSFFYLNYNFEISLTLRNIFKSVFKFITWVKIRIIYYTNNWIYTTNHKRIAVNYFWFVILAGIVGMVLATIVRLELAYPGVGIFAGDSLQYLSMVTAHGVIMVFFMIMPLLFGAFGNFLLPTQLGVHDVAFPRLNSAAFWFLPAGLIMLAQLVCIDRRYQRMNCFNIREVQSLLKRKFFNDLINTHDYKNLLNKSMIGLKYKTNDLNFVDFNTKLFYNFGIDFSNKNKNIYYNKQSTELNNSSSLNVYFFKLIELFETFKRSNNFSTFLSSEKLSRIRSTNVPELIDYFLSSTIHFLIISYNLLIFFLVTNFNNLNLSYVFFLNVNYITTVVSNYRNFSNVELLFLLKNFQNNYFLYHNNTLFASNSYLFTFNKVIYRSMISKNKITLNDLDYNSNLSYFYIFFYFLTNLPVFVLTYIINVFKFKDASHNLNNFFNFFFNWYIPTLLDGHLITNFLINFKINFSFFFKLTYFFEILTNICFYFFIIMVNFLILKLNNFLQYYDFFITKNFIFFYLFDKINEVFELINISFNFCKFFTIIDLTGSYLLLNNLNVGTLYLFKSDYFSLSKAIDLKLANQELSIFYKNQKNANPVFKYDYKSGDYFPKFNKETYNYLLTTLTDLTNGLRTSPWFLSNNFNEFFIINFSNFNQKQKNNGISYLNGNKFFNTNGFYNVFHTLSLEDEFFNKRWVSFNTLNQKFYKMFITSSMQQRIYSNWRQLKFTREAWRCKLLSARHQKTLYKRYVNEDGVFWSIERNAKDLLPGWAMITPFSSRTRFTAIGKVDIGLLGVFLVLNSSIISGANFLVTYRYLSTLNNRKMRDARAFFTEGIMVASWMMIAANPMLIIGIIMLLSDRHWQTSFFDYSGGGDTVMFQHMFWFFGHPEVYIIVIPVFGFTNTIISYYLRKRVSARASLLYSMYTIAFLGFFVWGHHMYMVGLAHTTRMLFSTLTVMISVPAATKLMHWCVTLANSAFTMELPLLFILTFVFFFVSGGISGMCVAHTGMDILFHDTFYVVGHFHVMLAGAAMFGSFGAFYFYFTAIFGVKYSRIFAYLHYTYYLIGQLMTVIPMFWLGYAGMPRRVLDYPASMGGWHSVISAGHLLSVAGLISFFIMIFDSLRQAKATTRNTFGINRFNTRLNFYLYEISKLTHVQRKSLFLYKYLQPYSLKLNKLNYVNYEKHETTLLSYTFFNKNNKQVY